MNYFKTAYKNCFLLLLFIIFSRNVFSQTKSVVAPKLNTTGLANEKLIRNIFTGDFAAINFDREEPIFSLILTAYINAYWQNCGSSLPTDKVEIISRAIHTSIYATPAMSEAETTIFALQKSNDLSILFQWLKQGNAVGATLDIDEQAVIIMHDMKSFFSMNDCNSAGVKRFEQNLYAFAMNTRPVVLEGSTISRLDPKIVLKDQNFDTLIDDLIYDQSKSWVIN